MVKSTTTDETRVFLVHGRSTAEKRCRTKVVWCVSFTVVSEDITPNGHPDTIMMLQSTRIGWPRLPLEIALQT